MSKFAELPDGTKLEFPDDTQDSVIDSVVKKHLGVSVEQPTPKPVEKSSWYEDILGGVVQGGNTAMGALDSAAAGLASLAGYDDDASQIISAKKDRDAYWQENSPIANKQQGVSGKILSGLAQVPQYMAAPLAAMQVVGAGVNSAENTLNDGGDLSTALKAGAISTGLNTAMVAVPPVLGAGKAVGASVGAGLGAGQTAVDPIAQNMLRKQNNLPEVPMPELEDYLANAALGGGVGGMLSKSKAAKPLSADALKLQELRAKQKTEAQPEQMPTQQTELDLGQPNQYGHRPSDFTVDENGIPIRRDASLEAQETVRGGDLFSRDNQANELRNDVINRAEPTTEGIPGSRDYLRKQEEELAYQQKAKQDSLFPEEPVAEPTQSASLLEKFSNDRTTNRPSPNRGKFGQGGAIDPDVFLKDFPEFVSSVLKDATGKLMVLYHGTSKDKIFDNFKNDKRGTFLTSDPEVASMYAKDNESKGPKYDYDKGKYVEQNTADRVMPVYANLKNPYKLTEQETQAFRTTSNYAKMQRDLRARVEHQGHDGVLYPDGSIVVFDPKNIVSATSPKLGQSKFGKGQKGSIGFFGKDPYQKFAENLRKEVPDATDAEIAKLWEEKQKTANPALAQQAKVSAQNGAVKDITGYDPKYTGEVWAPEKAVEVFSTIQDISPAQRGIFREQVGSSGRIQRDRFNHPVTTWVYNLTTKAVENGRIQARKILDDNGTGVIPQIRNHIMTSLTGEKEMRALMKWRFDNEGKGATLPDTFSKTAQKINDMLNKGDDQLLAKMNEVLAKDGKKPIHAIDNHMVHYWSGPYRAYIYVKTEGGGSKLATYVSEKTHADAQKALDWIKKNVPNVDLEKSQGIKFVKSDARTRSSMFDHLLELNNNTDPSVAAVLEAFKERIQGVQEKHLSEHNRQKYRTGVQGYLGAKPWMTEARNYADSIESIRTKFDAGYQWIAAQEIRQQLEPVLKAQQEGKIAVGNALALGQKYIDHALGKNIDTSAITKFADYLEDMDVGSKYHLVGKTRQGLNTTQHIFSRITLPYLLALKGTQAVQSVLQVGQATIPRMLELQKVYGGEYSHIGTSLAQGSMDGLFQLTNTLTLGKFEHLSGDLMRKFDGDFSPVTKAIHEAIRDQDIARMSLSDTGVSKEGGFFKSYGNAIAERFLDAPMNIFEGPTRTWAFSAYVRQAVKDGHSIPDAIKLGREQMDTMVNYNPEASSMGLANMGVVGHEARGLHTFMLNYYSQLMRYVDLAKNDKQAAPLLSYLGITFALGGAIGFIGTDLADWLVDGVKAAMRGTKFDNPDIQKFSLRQMMIENAPEALSVGVLSTATDLGLYGSFTTKVVDPDRTLIDNMFPKTMASIQLTKGALNSPKLFNPNLSQKERGKIIEDITPKFMTQTIRNRYQNKDGTVYDPSPDRPGLPMYQRTEKEQKISEKGFGVRGLAETLAQNETSNYYKASKNVSESQRKQLDRLDSLLVATIKKGGEPTAFQKQAIEDQMSSLIGKWRVDDVQIQKRIEQLAQDYGIPAETLRRLVKVKDPKLADVDKIQTLTGMIKRSNERQEKYGR